MEVILSSAQLLPLAVVVARHGTQLVQQAVVLAGVLIMDKQVLVLELLDKVIRVVLELPVQTMLAAAVAVQGKPDKMLGRFLLEMVVMVSKHLLTERQLILLEAAAVG